MAYRENASDKEICDQLCPYHIGDTVTLTKALKAEDGVFETGTKLEILSVTMRQDLKIRSVPLEQLPLFQADIGVFDFELVDAETSIKVNAAADYWGESLVSKKRMKHLLFRLYFPPVCASVCMVPFLFVDDLAVITALSCAFLWVCTAFSVRDLRKRVKPDLWRLHDCKHYYDYTL